MKKIAQGLPLKKYIGNKHKDGGIMVNALGNKTKDVNKAVAEVEGGEYNFRYDSTNPMNNYIIPARETFPEVNDMAKQADRFKGNNRIDYNTRTNLLNKSMKLNEMLRVQQEQQPMQIAAFGGKLKKYKPGGPLPYDGTNPMDDVSMQNSYRAVSTPGNEITNTPIQPTAPLLSGSQKFALPTKVQSVNPKVNNLDVSKEMEQASSPVKQKKNNFKGALSAVSGAVSALGPIGQGVGAAMQLAPYAIDLGKAMFDKTSVQDLQTQGSAMRLPNTTYAKHGGKLNVVPLPRFRNGTNINPFDKVTPSTKVTGTIPLGRVDDMNSAFNRRNPSTIRGLINSEQINLQELITNPFNRRSGTPSYIGNNKYEYPFNQSKTNTPVTTTRNNRQVQSNPINPATNANSSNTVPTVQQQVVPQKTQWEIDFDARTNASKNPLQAEDDAERIKEYDRTIGIPNALRSLEASKTIEANNQKKLLDIVEPPKQKDKLSEMLKSGLMLKGSAMAGSLFSALQPAQKETLRLPDFGRADDAMSRATAFSMNPALNEVEQARGKSQEAIRNMATTAGQYTSNMQSVNQRAGQQAAGLRVQEQQIMNQLAGQKAGYETQKASAIQQELARFDENTLMNKAATQDARVAFVENINNLGTEIMKQGNEQDIADQQDKLAVQNAKLKIIQSAFENPDIISGANLESILKMIEKGDYTNIPKLFGQPSDTRRVLKAEADRQAAKK